MKRLFLASLVFFMMSSLVFGATLNLRATWTANTEPDMKEYKLYRTDGTRTLIATINHPTVLHDFTITVPDGSAGTLTFVLVAVDTNSNASGDSNTAPFSFNLDVTPPAPPSGLSIQAR